MLKTVLIVAGVGIGGFLLVKMLTANQANARVGQTPVYNNQSSGVFLGGLISGITSGILGSSSTTGVQSTTAWNSVTPDTLNSLAAADAAMGVEGPF